MNLRSALTGIATGDQAMFMTRAAIAGAILLGLVEHEKSVDQMVAEGFDHATVARIERLLNVAEYKRRQAPPGVRVSRRAFGRDWRYPITSGYRR